MKIMYLENERKGVCRKMASLKNIFCMTAGIIGGIVSHIFGGWSAALTTLVIFMGVDYITGIIVAGVFHRSSKSETGGLKSLIGWKGLCKKGVTLAIVMVSYRLDLLMGTSYIKNAVIIAFCVNELLSIIENAGLMGIPIPDSIKNAIEILNMRAKDESN